MHIVFLNRMERLEGSLERHAQVFIGESQGVWTAGWKASAGEPGEEGETWYDGVSWEELLVSFRHGVARKLREGFRPLLDGMLEDAPEWERKPQLSMLLECYADMQDAEETAEKLRSWRRSKAQEEGRPAYLIANNKELRMLAVFVPKTPEELEQLPGFGKMKKQRYGAELSALLMDVPRAHAFPLRWVEGAVAPAQYEEWLFRMREEKYGKALATVREKRVLLTAIRDGKSLAELESELSCTRRELVERIEKLDVEGYDVLPIVERELAEVLDEERELAERAMRELGDAYLKPLLRKIYGEPSSGDEELERKYERLRMLRIRFRRERQSAV